MNRLFAFGCSYTKNEFPTWADLLSNHYDSYENWGLTGLGNRGIFNRLNEAIMKREIGKDDTVVVMWSSPTREDRWFDRQGWITLGNIYNQHFYPDEWVEKYFDPFMSLMETVNYVNAAQHLLENIKCKWIMAWMVAPLPENPDNNWGEMSHKNVPLAELCDPSRRLTKYIRQISNHSNMIPGEMEAYKNSIHDERGVPTLYMMDRPDGHPNTLDGYYYLVEKVLPRLGIENFDSDKKIFEMAKHWAEYTSVEYARRGPEPKFSFKIEKLRDVEPTGAF